MKPIITNVNEMKLVYRPKKCLMFDHKLNSSAEMYPVLMSFYDFDTIAIAEEFIVIYLTHAHKVIGVYNASRGGINSTIVDTRIVMNIALRSLCSAIVISHNHPSGNLKASEADKKLTQELKKCCEFHNIVLLDHIIVSPFEEYLSFSDSGLI